MELTLAYGKSGLLIKVPDANFDHAIHMVPSDPVQNPEDTIRELLAHPTQSQPLAELARGRNSAVVVISDITRPVPNKVILPILLETIENEGIPRDKITILIATGIHRPNLGDELIELVGEDIAQNYRVINHYSEDPEACRYVGHTDEGIPIYVNKHYLEADLKILTGLVELHLMAGYSGGRKAILPGIASLETMKHMHGYRMIQKDETCNAKLQGNPFHEAAVKIARQVGVDFIVNVTLDESRRITGIFAGDLEAAHEQACALVEKNTVRPIDKQYDIVVTCGGGYPLDKTMYQTFKGFVGALEAVKEGGTIIIAAQNEEGIGSPEFSGLLKRLENPMQFYELTMKPNYVAKDQWMIQELVNGLHRCQLLYYTEGIADEELRQCLVQPIASVEDGIDQALRHHGHNASILVIPEGPYVLPKPPVAVDHLYSWQT
jgi:lactate racemase